MAKGGGENTWQGACMARGGAYVAGGMHGKGGGCAGETATEASGMHPTLTHSCF